MSNKKTITIETQFEFFPEGATVKTIAKKIDNKNTVELRYLFNNVQFGKSVVRLHEFTEQSVCNITRFLIEDDLKEMANDVNTIIALFRKCMED